MNHPKNTHEPKLFYALVPVKVVTYKGKVEGVEWPTLKVIEACLKPLNSFQTDSDAIAVLEAFGNSGRL